MHVFKNTQVSLKLHMLYSSILIFVFLKNKKKIESLLINFLSMFFRLIFFPSFNNEVFIFFFILNFLMVHFDLYLFYLQKQKQTKQNYHKMQFWKIHEYSHKKDR